MIERQDTIYPKRPVLTVVFIMILANGAGALAMIVFMLFIAPIPEGELAVSFTRSDILLQIIGVQAALIVIANVLVRLNDRHVSTWYRRLQNGANSDDLPDAARREVLNFPLRMAGISLFVWLLAGILFGFGISQSVMTFLASTCVGGGFAAVLTFFGVELFWRRIILIFFSRDSVHNVHAFRLSVFARILMAFLLISIYPVALLIALSLNRARAMVTAPNPDVILQNLFLLEMFLLGVTLVASVTMAYFLNRALSEPLSRLEQAMSRIQNNDLHVHVPVTSNDEIGYVSERFNAMVKGLQQAERLRVLLNLYISPEVAREALEHGAKLGGQLVECAVLFADIRGFTAISEQLTPERLIRLLNGYMSTMVEVITMRKGMVNKFGGDSLLAVFGTPLNPDVRYAQSAFATAMAMLEALQRFNRQQAQEGAPELRIGIGIASGPLVAGNIGGQSRIEYTVIGDTVNLASRLQSTTKRLGVTLLIDETTARELPSQERSRLTALPEMTVRGKAEPVKMYTLNGA